MSKIVLAEVEYISLPSLAKSTGLPSKTLLATIKKNVIGHKKIGGTHFINCSEWTEWCKK